MIPSKQLWISFTFALSLFCSTNLQAALTTDVRSQTNALNEFAFDLYNKINQTERNIVISPYSLSSLLAILTVGAAGDTQIQLNHLLHFDDGKNANYGVMFNEINLDLLADNNKKPPSFLIANSFWADNNFSYKTSFLDTLQQNKTIEFNRVNFNKAPEAARNTINHWVEHNTNNLIKQLIPQKAITTDTKLVLVNAIYFNGIWQSPFKPEETKDLPFIVTDKQSVQAPMMAKEDSFLYTENDKVQLLQLPYLNTPIRMAILLPKWPHTMNEIQPSLNQTTFSKLLQSSKNQKVNVSLPRFQLESTFFNLADTIQAMGATDAFSQKANFSNITASELVISKIMQKAIIQVDEKGTIATAATAITMYGNSIHTPPIYFNANHPFTFILYDSKTGIILFIGQVYNPAPNTPLTTIPKLKSNMPANPPQNKGPAGEPFID